MQRSVQFDATPDDLIFPEFDHRSDDFDSRFGTRALANHVLKGAVILGTAIGIPGTVFGHRADVDFAGPDGFGPAHGDAEKMRVAERHVSDRDLAAARAACGRGELIFRHGNALVGECRTTDGAEIVELNDEPPIRGNGVEVGNSGEGATFARLRALAVAGVQECDAVFAVACNRLGGADAGVHAATEENDGGGFGVQYHGKNNYSAWRLNMPVRERESSNYDLSKPGAACRAPTGTCLI